MPTKTKGRKPWTDEQKQAARDAYAARMREKETGELPTVHMGMIDNVQPTVTAVDLGGERNPFSGPFTGNANDIPMTATAAETAPTRQPAEDYEFEVWRRDRATEKPVHWRHFHADGSEWVYHEKQNFMNDSGYGTFIDDRVVAMVKNAFRSLKNPNLYYERFGPEVRTANGQPTGTSDYSKLPKFDPEERVIEIIVRIR